MKRATTLITSLLITSMLITGCGLSGATQTPDQGMVQTSVAETIVALQATMAANATPTPALPTETPTTQPTLTPEATLQPTAMPSPTVTSRPAYLISDVKDITYPDNTVVNPGDKFTKTWRVTNAGVSTWTSDFKIVFVSGNQMSAGTPAIGQSVAPNQSVDISLELTAPSTPDTYTGYFMLQAPNGARFGFGSDGNNAFWVKVKVETFFQVTNAKANVSPTSYSGTCPYAFSLSATITVTAPGTVTYKYVTSTGESKLYTMTFTAAGSNTSAVETWTVTASQTLDVHIYVDSPNHQDFSVVSIPVTCTP